MPLPGSPQSTVGSVRYERADAGTLCVHVVGDWLLHGERPQAEAPDEQLANTAHVRFDASKLGTWDSRLIVFLDRLCREAREAGCEVLTEGLPPGAVRLLRLAEAVPEQEAEAQRQYAPVIAALGQRAVAVGQAAMDMVRFVGEVALSLGRLFTGHAQMRWRDVGAVIVASGPDALPIVTLISFLVGLILAFVGAIQLRMFGAEIFVADLVGIGVIRNMGAIMVGVVMAGRTGAAFAAQLGTMQVNEEIDAFHTMSVSPVDFLVVPRMLGLTLMMPFLCIYADLMGTLGGLFVGVTMLDLGAAQYYIETKSAVGVNDLIIGVTTCTVYGVLISFSGCYRGMRCGRSSADVGEATTASVVTSVVMMVVATAIITVICDILGV
jgi:phospholipid/cholesterol/gamma-HCH transport system permease protein